MKGRVAVLVALLTWVSTISLAEPPAQRASYQLFEGHLLQRSDSSAWEAPATLRLFRSPPARKLELEATSTPPLAPVRDVLSPVDSFGLFDRLGPAAGRESLEAMLDKSAGDRLLLHGVLTNPWYEETHEVGRFFSVRYSEGPLCGPQDPQRLTGAN